MGNFLPNPFMHFPPPFAPIYRPSTNLRKKVSSTEKNIPQKSINFFEEPLIEFGDISLYFDDVVILLVLYFLYKENVNDTLLYLVLFMLLF